MTGKKLILASASPRRSELLARFGLAFEVVASSIDESRYSDLASEIQVAKLSYDKAADVGRLREGIIIAADTIVTVDDELLGKAASASEATAMLEKLSGRAHRVLTGLTVLDSFTGNCKTAVEETEVCFKPLSKAEIVRYIETGEYIDKAGSYAAQGAAAAFITGVTGCYYNVVGLPLFRLSVLLAAFNIWLI